MVFPSKNAIFRGFFFVIAVVIYLMCERWMQELKVVGTPIYQAHVFNHVFLLWTIKQFLLLGLYFLWKAIDTNFIGMGHFKHAESDESERELTRQRIPGLIDRHNSVPNGAAANGSVNNDEAPVVRPRTHTKKKSYTWFLFLLPSIFSQSHVILYYFGLQLTYPSSVIMLTGTAGVFVTLLSLAFLAKPISCAMWFGVSLSFVGFAISGFSDYFQKPQGYEAYGIAAGGLLYTMSQITITTQMIYEEKFMRKLSIHPMKFLGSEGVFSFVFSLIMLASFCLSDTQYSDLPNNRIEDIEDFGLQFANSWKVMLAVFGSMISYVIFTYLGIILIKDHGAMARIMIEALAWCIYWVILVSIGWEQYYITQIPGLVLVPTGILIFSRIVGCPCSRAEGTLSPDTLNQNGTDELEGVNDDTGPINCGAVDVDVHSGYHDSDDDDDEHIIEDGNRATYAEGSDVPLLKG